MHIINAMFSKGLGGIEQALVDYSEALKLAGHKVTVIIAPKAKIKASLTPLGVNIIEVKNFSAWDIFAKLYLQKILKQLAPDAIIVHGNRAVSLIGSELWKGGRKQISPSPITRNPSPFLIGVTHNYSIRRLIGLDAILAITEDLKQKVIAAGQPADTVFKLPNMVRVRDKGLRDKGIKEEYANKTSSLHPLPLTPITIGTMGRFVPKKGFDVFIRAIARLKKEGIGFRAVIGGGGEEEENLKQLAQQLDVSSCLKFLGWVEDKDKFFEEVDIFVLPSLHEPFGIILLEAFAKARPVIATDSEGPREIAVHEEDALVVPRGDADALAKAMQRLASDKVLAKKIAKNGFAKAHTYDIKNFAASLNDVLIRIKNHEANT